MEELNIHNEMSEAEKAAFEGGEALGEQLGTDSERAWYSGNKLEGTPLMEEHKGKKVEATKNMDEKEKAAFEKGYLKGMKVGKDREAEWQSKQEDKR